MSNPPTGAEPSTLAFLHAHGISTRPEHLDELLEQAIDLLPKTLYPTDPRDDLPAPDVEALLRGGFDLVPREGHEAKPLASTAVEYAALLATAYTTSAAAELLGVGRSRISQRLNDAPPTLYGVRLSKSWRLPRFQFAGGSELPGLALVVRRLSPAVHPVAVRRWFLTPHPDLETTESSDPLSPREWLRLGYPPQIVADLASHV